jgi:hypothetical protein
MVMPRKKANSKAQKISAANASSSASDLRAKVRDLRADLVSIKKELKVKVTAAVADAKKMLRMKHTPKV